MPLIPLLILPFAAAAALLSGLSAGLLAFALSQDGYYRFPIFLSIPFWLAVYGSQWSVIFGAAFLLPTLSFVYVCKPSIGLAMLAAKLSRNAIVACIAGSVVLVLISLAMAPQWPLEWLATVRANSAHMHTPIMKPGGLITLLALLKWRRPEARLIIFLALVPQNNAWYDSVPLLLVPSTLMQSVIHSFAISIPSMIEVMTKGGADGWIDFYLKGYQLTVFAYLPAIIMVLMRPNESYSFPSNPLRT